MTRYVNMEKPAEGIFHRRPIGDWQPYVLECDCTDGDHQITFSAEVENEYGLVGVLFEFKTITPASSSKNLWHRIKTASRILFYGYEEQHRDVILSPQTALNLAGTLTDVVKEIQEENEK